MTKYLMSNGDSLASAMLLGFAAWVTPEAAIGASFGAMFFMLSGEHHPIAKRVAYAAISLCIGYGAGLASPQGWAMLISAASASVAVVTLVSLSKSIEAGEVTGAIKLIIDIARGRK